MNTITIPRLWMWVPNEGWRPAAIAGTAWDAKQWRIQYRARKVCTLWIKAGLERQVMLNDNIQSTRRSELPPSDGPTWERRVVAVMDHDAA